MKELEVTVVVRNNRLKERRLALGMTQQLLAAAADIPQQEYSALECMRRSPLGTGRAGRKRKDESDLLYWSKTALALATFHEVEPDELFPEAVQHIQQDRIVRLINLDEVRSSLAAPEMLPGLPEGLIDMDRATTELRARVERVIGTLTPREREVLSKRFGLGNEPPKTLEAIGKDQGVSRERIRGIESKALGRLREPSKAAVLLDGLGKTHEMEILDKAIERAARQTEKTERKKTRERQLLRSVFGFGADQKKPPPTPAPPDDEILFLVCVPCDGTREPIRIWPRSQMWLDLIDGWKQHFGIPTTKSETLRYVTRAELACARHGVPVPMVVRRVAKV